MVMRELPIKLGSSFFYCIEKFAIDFYLCRW